MRHTRPSMLSVVILSLALSGLYGCGSDDNSTTPPDADSTAPLVMDLEPEELDQDVAVDAVVTIIFSEAMDTGTATGEITLSEGSITNMTWTDGTRLDVTHSDWSVASSVTVTVGTGLTDVAGNALPQSFSATFYTTSPVPVLIETDLPDPLATELNYDPVMIFSHEMDLLSVYNATTITEPGGGKAIPEYQIGTVGGDYRRVRIRFLSDLTPLTTYRVQVSTDAVTRFGATNLTAAVDFTFTTGTDADDTPPFILSTVPALDSVASTDLPVITVTFNEPIDTERVEVQEMSAIMRLLSLREPAWNAEGDEMRIYMQTPLPAGVRIFAVFEDYDFYDVVGNGNATMDSLSFTTAGNAEMIPMREDLRLYYGFSEEDKADRYAKRTISNISGSTFVRTLLVDYGSGWETEEEWRMRQNNDGIYFRGMADEESWIMFDPEVLYLPDPVPATWSGTTTMSMGSHSATLAFSGELEETGRKRVYFRDKSKSVDCSYYYLENCVSVYLLHSITPTGAASAVDIGEDWVSFCPGLGIVEMGSEGTEYEDGVETGTYGSEYWIEAAALSDHLEDK